MRIVFTRHAEKKFKDLQELGVYVDKTMVVSILNNPVQVDAKCDYPNRSLMACLTKNTSYE